MANFLFTIAMCFCSFYILSIIYNLRLEFITSDTNMKRTYADAHDVRIGNSGQYANLPEVSLCPCLSLGLKG